MASMRGEELKGVYFGVSTGEFTFCILGREGRDNPQENL